MVFRGAKLHFFFHTTIHFYQKKCIFSKNMLYNIFFYLFNWKKSSNFAAVKNDFFVKTTIWGDSRHPICSLLKVLFACPFAFRKQKNLQIQQYFNAAMVYLYPNAARCEVWGNPHLVALCHTLDYTPYIYYIVAPTNKGINIIISLVFWTLIFLARSCCACTLFSQAEHVVRTYFCVRWTYDERAMTVRWTYDDCTMTVRWLYDGRSMNSE